MQARLDQPRVTGDSSTKQGPTHPYNECKGLDAGKRNTLHAPQKQMPSRGSGHTKGEQVRTDSYHTIDQALQGSGYACTAC